MPLNELEVLGSDSMNSLAKYVGYAKTNPISLVAAVVVVLLLLLVTFS